MSSAMEGDRKYPPTPDRLAPMRALVLAVALQLIATAALCAAIL